MDVHPADFAPVRIDEVELGEPLPARSEAESGAALSPRASSPPRHAARLGPGRGSRRGARSRDALASRLQAALGEEIDRHLLADGLEPVGRLGAEGIPGPMPRPRAWPQLDDLLPTRAERLGRDPDPGPPRIRCSRPCPASCARNYPGDRFEVIVVDNALGARRDGSTSPARARRGRRDPPAAETMRRRLRTPATGDSQAAGGEIVVFADDDVVVDRDWLATLALAFARGERVGGAAGLTLPGALETPAQRWFEGFGSANARLRDPRLRSAATLPRTSPSSRSRSATSAPGENMAFRRELLLRPGRLRPRSRPRHPAHDGDDVEALLRVLLSGSPVVHEPAAIVWHAHPRELRASSSSESGATASASPPA